MGQSQRYQTKRLITKQEFWLFLATLMRATAKRVDLLPACAPLLPDGRCRNIFVLIHLNDVLGLKYGRFRFLHSLLGKLRAPQLKKIVEILTPPSKML